MDNVIEYGFFDVGNLYSCHHCVVDSQWFTKLREEKHPIDAFILGESYLPQDHRMVLTFAELPYELQVKLNFMASRFGLDRNTIVLLLLAWVVSPSSDSYFEPSKCAVDVYDNCFLGESLVPYAGNDLTGDKTTGIGEICRDEEDLYWKPADKVAPEDVDGGCPLWTPSPDDEYRAHMIPADDDDDSLMKMTT